MKLKPDARSLLVAIFIGVSAIAAVLIVAGCSNREHAVVKPCHSAASSRAQTSCYAKQILAVLNRAPNPNVGLPKIQRAAEGDQGFLAENCHVVMHTVGRHYGAEHHITLAGLMAFLPKDNDPGCSAGFAHGLITHVAPQIDLVRPRRSAAICDRVKTRYERYSCIHGFGHAFMRLYVDELSPALSLCSRLASRDAPDCAQGAFHDYWFAVVGEDETKRPKRVVTTPRLLCARQPRRFVQPCWYRAFIETRPSGYHTRTPGDLLRICRGVSGLQRKGCITAASVIGSTNPLKQFRVCAALPDADVVSCLHGVKVQNLIGTPEVNQIRVIERCDWFRDATRIACYEWFGKTFAVVTNGKFETTGCGRIDAPDARQACVRGAREMNKALVTFS